MAVHLLAVVGTSPGVVTELMWWLEAVEGLAVSSVEIWTTTVGLEALRNWSERTRAWEKLGAALGPSPERPLPDAQWLPSPPPAHPHPVPGSFSHVVPSREGVYLEDIRTSDDAQLLYAALYARVRELCRVLGEEEVLVGSLAGGRKTMSAALDLAFSMHARSQDRLYHVLTHPRIEADAARRASFAFPTAEVEAALGVPLAQQIEAYAVPVPRWRALLAMPKGGLDAIVRGLDELDFEALWSTVPGVSAAVRAEVQDTGDTATLRVLAGAAERVSWELSRASAALYLVLAQHPEGLTHRQWHEAVNAVADGRDLARATLATHRKRANRLQEDLETLELQFPSFFPYRDGSRWRIPGAVTVVKTWRAGA